MQRQRAEQIQIERWRSSIGKVVVTNGGEVERGKGDHCAARGERVLKDNVRDEGKQGWNLYGQAAGVVERSDGPDREWGGCGVVDVAGEVLRAAADGHESESSGWSGERSGRGDGGETGSREIAAGESERIEVRCSD